MTGAALVSDRVREAFQPTPRGVVGLVDDLLSVGREHPLHLDYADGRCQVRLADAPAFEVPVPKSVFRAALARVAALCNERTPDAVPPYGGEGELPGDDAAARVSFVNTPAVQRLDVQPASAVPGAASKFTVLLRDNRTVTVYGHTLRYVPHAAAPADAGSYGVVSRVDGAEVLVALFPLSEVRGVFRGDLATSDGSQDAA